MRTDTNLQPNEAPKAKLADAPPAARVWYGGVLGRTLFLIVLIVIVGAGYLVYSDRQRLGLGRVLDVRSASENAGTAGADSAAILSCFSSC